MPIAAHVKLPFTDFLAPIGENPNFQPIRGHLIIRRTSQQPHRARHRPRLKMATRADAADALHPPVCESCYRVVLGLHSLEQFAFILSPEALSDAEVPPALLQKSDTLANLQQVHGPARVAHENREENEGEQQRRRREGGEEHDERPLSRDGLGLQRFLGLRAERVRAVAGDRRLHAPPLGLGGALPIELAALTSRGRGEA
ncbi:hypothetical protein ON010_g10936 [Phytophthora cinnamomi]|nr:hypothetical protein ON010_g10936 [Phytophthora cinnamomi]